MSAEGFTRAELARRLGVSRAHVTQILRLLNIAPSAKEVVLGLGDPMVRRQLGAHTLRSLIKLSAEEQQHRVIGMIKRRER